MQQIEPGNQANVEYFFRLLYDWIYGDHGAVNLSGLQSFLAHIWLWIIVIGYALSVLGLFLIVYCTVRLFELRKREHLFYTTLIPSPDAPGAMNARWQHIQGLAAGESPSQWREAIIEADIMLDDVLARQGYVGDGVGEKLKAIEPREFASLQDAWDAHKVRNQIAHQGSAFDVSETLARRTIARYETVFREFNAL